MADTKTTTMNFLDELESNSKTKKSTLELTPAMWTEAWGSDADFVQLWNKTDKDRFGVFGTPQGNKSAMVKLGSKSVAFTRLTDLKAMLTALQALSESRKK